MLVSPAIAPERLALVNPLCYQQPMTDTNDDDRRPPRGGRPRDESRPRGGRGPGAGRPAFGKPQGKPHAKPRFGSRPGRPGPDGADRKPGRNPPAPVVLGTDDAPPAEERIAKVIARAGIASRRDAEAMIEAGRVTLNGAPLTSPAVNVGPGDAITVDGEALPSRERTRLWLFHKPRGLVTTFRDPEGRPTVFDSLPEEMPRVVAIGRLDINTEGLLLLTNDGGLAKVVAHPETGWTRRYRARARGEVTQAQLDRLRGGITIDGMEYGPVEATLDRVQGDNSWISITLREGKNREVKRILEHLGLQVNRLIRLSFGPFQLGEIEPGLVEEIRTKVLKEQLGEGLAAEAGADFESPVRTPIAPFGKPARTNARPPRSRTAAFRDEGGRFARPAPERDFDRPARGTFGARPGPREERAPHEGRGARPREREDRGRDLVWRADDDIRPPRPPRRERREDPKAEREASAARPRSRAKSIEGGEGRRILVERIVPPPAEEAPRHRRDRTEHPLRSDKTDYRSARPRRGEGRLLPMPAKADAARHRPAGGAASARGPAPARGAAPESVPWAARGRDPETARVPADGRDPAARAARARRGAETPSGIAAPAHPGFRRGERT